ncbi:7-carboxy-7-deazaguanine synthase QueE [Streptomyces colonosanans]|uniref:7-carboxy-7-deazaguanine synthase n=1 Tax=Streptomyces colonosanans TaxID=1428652 RepID=A0A1S2NZU2_9ACTN|nr:7-carboxy-7-deazaguanine synthase QueE [Streptomyces colonosanans]OIJ86424.1 7-carboxy-7-deazaguanine synthase QueE [Streptomyces colonosanans]
MTAELVGTPRRRRTLRIAETFADTVQGEGTSTGVPAAFIRFSLCNLTCRGTGAATAGRGAGCDTPYTWDTTRFDLQAESTWRDIDELVDWALSRPEKLVVVTGGEPLLQPGVLPLVQELRAADRDVEIETNGTIIPPLELVAAGPWFNVSPKLSGFGSGMPERKRIVPDALRAFASSGRARWKFVVQDPAELDEIAALEAAYGLTPIFVMPEGTSAEAVLDGMRTLAMPVMERGWRLGTRLHVLLWGDQRGR